ncbi:hypothetical protein KSF78_0003781 [Schistosoma japonicum]|nr:hypothetical protein KSF78_0003781 [Schistosoma japonicum]
MSLTIIVSRYLCISENLLIEATWKSSSHCPSFYDIKSIFSLIHSFIHSLILIHKSFLRQSNLLVEKLLMHEIVIIYSLFCVSLISLVYLSVKDKLVNEK